MTLNLILKVIPPVLQYSPCDPEHFAYNVDVWPWVTLTLTFKVIHLFLCVSGWSHWLKYFKPERNPFTSKGALIFRLIFGLSNLFDFCEQIEEKIWYYEDTVWMVKFGAEVEIWKNFLNFTRCRVRTLTSYLTGTHASQCAIRTYSHMQLIGCVTIARVHCGRRKYIHQMAWLHW